MHLLKTTGQMGEDQLLAEEVLVNKGPRYGPKVLSIAYVQQLKILVRKHVQNY